VTAIYKQNNGIICCKNKCRKWCTCFVLVN